MSQSESFASQTERMHKNRETSLISIKNVYISSIN